MPPTSVTRYQSLQYGPGRLTADVSDGSDSLDLKSLEVLDGPGLWRN
jgi:hypothetical protein